MDLIFIRHGQGEHNLPVPNRLDMYHPSLTPEGRSQVMNLRSENNISSDDLLLVSPTVRTLETAIILTEHLQHAKTYITPLVGPRMFPQNPEWKTLNCDQILSIERIKKEYSQFKHIIEIDKEFWNEGINTIEDRIFNEIGHTLINWIRVQKPKNVFLITHDGTITSYKILLGQKGLTRSDFLGEAGIHKIKL